MRWSFRILLELPGNPHQLEVCQCHSAEAVGEILHMLAKYTDGRKLTIEPLLLPSEQSTGDAPGIG